VGDIGGFANMRKGLFDIPGAHSLVVGGVPPLGVELARRHTVQTHRRPPLVGKGAGEFEHPGPSGCRMSNSRNAPSDRGDDLTDRSTRSVEHARTEGLGHVPCAVQVEIDHRSPPVRAEIARLLWELPASIVHQDVHLTVTISEGVHRVKVADINEVDTDCATRRLFDTHCGLAQPFLSTCSDCDVGSRCREAGGDRTAEAASTTGDKCGSSAEQVGMKDGWRIHDGRYCHLPRQQGDPE